VLGAEALTGRTHTHVIELRDPPCRLHPQAAVALQAMRAAAAAQGIDILPASSYRDFDRQLGIWNAKFRGERTLLDRSGQPLAFNSIPPEDLIDTILAWSALPGASRHHWGSDLDVIDGNALRARQTDDPQFRAQLLPQEFARKALFAPLDVWLEANAGRFGFFRPYRQDLGGVLPEPWHISYAPVATAALAAFDCDMLAEAIAGAELAGAETVLRRLPELVQRYVRTVAPPA
jgi:LAS superfamily LD-carboxypeptidase LdcB